MQDTVPVGMTVDSLILNGWTCTPAIPLSGAATLTCERDYTETSPLAPGAGTPPVTVRTNVTQAGALNNTLTVESPNSNIIDTNAPNDTATFGITAQDSGNSADVSIGKSRASATLQSGEEQVYTLEIVNDGASPSEDVRVVDRFLQLVSNGVGPDGEGYISHTINAGPHATGFTCANTVDGVMGQRLQCDIDLLNVCVSGSDCPTITVSVRHGGDAGTIYNTATATSRTTPDPILGNNNDTVSFTQTRRVDLTTEKTASGTSAASGQNVTYILAIRNVDNGWSTAEDLVLTDTLPHGMVYVSHTVNGSGSCATAPASGSITGPGNDELICQIATLPNGAQRTVSLVMRPTNALVGNTITNDIKVETTSVTVPETDIEPNTDSVDVTIEIPRTDLLISKDDGPDPLTLGSNTTYTITVTNAGPSASEDIVITDDWPTSIISYQELVTPLPAGMNCPTEPAIGPSGYGQQLICTYPYLAAGESVTLQALGKGEAKTDIVNNVSVSSSEIINGYDTQTVNNSTVENTSVRTITDVELVSKVASKSPVELEEAFNFVITVRVNDGPGLAEADDVVVTDTLPSGMILTGTPSSPYPGAVCSGGAGQTSFTCLLGTIPKNVSTTITVPVEIPDSPAGQTTFTNETKVATSSFESDPDNNTKSGSVNILSSSLAGTVYRDFDDGGSQNGSDSGIGNVRINLSGTSAGGRPITRTTTTDGSGNYNFALLPAGDYTVTLVRSSVTEPYLNVGQPIPGTVSGVPTGSGSDNVISSIIIPGNSDAPDYDFTYIPQPRIGIAKRVNSPVAINADGTFNVTFRMNVENFSLEALNGVSVTDVLAGGNPLFGSHVSLGNPATGAMTAGQYTILNAPSGTCGGNQASFDGSGQQTLASGFTLAANATCRIDVSLRIRPATSSQTFLNQANVTGTGAETGINVNDLSDDGTNPDPNNNNSANDPNESDPTPVAPVYHPGIALIKVADTSALSSPPAPTETVSYTFQVRNTGDVTLTNVVLADTLSGIVLSGGPIESLAPGATDTGTFTATYALDQDDIDDGEVTNTATVTGTDPFGTDVDDVSGTGFGNDTPTVADIPQVSSIAVIKIEDASGVNDPAQLDDPITYRFEVRNTGNVRLTNVNVVDPLPGIVMSGGPIAVIQPGDTDTTTFTASYEVQQGDIDAAEVRNQARVTARNPDDALVEDFSGDNYAVDNPVVVPLVQDASVALIKIADTAALQDPPLENDVITYRFQVRNTGNTTLDNITVSDPLPGVTMVGGPITSLAPGDTDTTTLTATYPITQENIDAGEVENSAEVSAGVPGGGTVKDKSGETFTDDLPVTVPLEQNPAIGLIKFADVGGLSADPVEGETVAFTFQVTNTGNVTLTNITVDDLLTDAVTTGGPLATLAPGDSDTTTFEATYALKQADVDAEFIENTARATGETPSGTDVDDLSGTTLTDDDPLVVPLEPNPSITLIKTADTSGLSTPPASGDIITYAFEIQNNGNVTLNNVLLSDILPDLVLSGGPIPTLNPGMIDDTTYTASYEVKQSDINTGQIENLATVTGTSPGGVDVTDDSGALTTEDAPTVVPLPRTSQIELIKLADTTGLQSPPQFGDVIRYSFEVRNTGNTTLTNVTVTDVLPGLVLTGDPIPVLEPGVPDTTTYSATYTIGYDALYDGEVVNSADVTGTPPAGGAPVTDKSGSEVGDDTPTTVLIEQAPAITLDKVSDDTNLLDAAEVGELITYTFTITNTGNMPLTNVTLSDLLPGLALTGDPIPRMNPAAVGDGTDIDTDTYTGSYQITADDILSREVVNDATVEGFWDKAETQTVLAEDQETTMISVIEALPEVFPPFTTDGGDTTSILESDTLNDEPATLETVTIRVISEDEGVTLNPETGIITLAPGQPAGSYEVEYEICSIDFRPLCDTTTERVEQQALPGIKATKTQELTDNGDGRDDVGDIVTYTITVQNTGNTVLQDVVLADTLTDRNGVPQTLDSGPTFVSADQGSGAGTLLIGETATYTASFELTLSVVNALGLENTAVATALPEIPENIGGDPAQISDQSDNGNDADGNTEDDKTILILRPSVSSEGITLTKTTPRRIVERGSAVPYTITIGNENNFLLGPVDVTDRLPPGFLYTPDSARIDGVEAVVRVDGSRIIFPALLVPAQGEVIVTLTARILNGTRSGRHTNIATLTDSTTGARLVPPAEAIVEILPEAVFDCGDVIGKVFDDLDGDGYQDDPSTADRGITDQNHYGGKYGGKLARVADEPSVERGLPGVRLATVDGLIITTDSNGLFSVPCAMLPADRGSNFILKIDERSLPTGYSMTTENPRVMRLTPGMMTEMNFGARLGRVIRVDLTDAAFVGGEGLSQALVSGISAMVQRLAKEPANVALVYHVPANADTAQVRAGRVRMKRVEAEIARQWRQVGRGRLAINTAIARNGK